MLTRAPIVWHRVTTDERGSVLVVTVVVMLTVLVTAAYAIDASIWFVHHRHLQTEADAAALAAAQNFRFPCSAAVEQNIKNSVEQYGGVKAYEGKLYNEQVPVTPTPSTAYSSTQHNLIAQINEPNFINQSQPNDGDLTKSPCANSAIDVKLSETNLPSFIPPLVSPKYITAQARVNIEQQTTATGLSPLAVAQTAPVAAKAYFVDEDNANKVIAESALQKLGPNSQGQDEWSSKEAVAVAINRTNYTSAHIGVVIALSGNAADTKCGDAYVQCFDEGSTGPLLHIAGYSLEGSGSLAAPLARQVTLSKPSNPEEACTDGYYSNSPSNCKFTISAKIDYGSESTNTKGVTVVAKVAKPGEATGSGPSAELKYNQATGLWTGTATLTRESGSNRISLLVKCKKEPLSPCPLKATEATVKEELEKGNPVTANVQRIYAAGSEHSGTITGAWISEPGGAEPVPGREDADSYEVCETKDGNSCTHNLAVTIDVAGSLGNAAGCSSEAACKAANAGFFDPLRKIKYEGNHVIVACPPTEKSAGTTVREHLAKGCPNGEGKYPGRYMINTSNPDCTVSTEPFDCVAFVEGKKTGPIQKGIDERLEEPPQGQFYCENNWKNNNNGGVPVIPSNDSRIVQVFVIPYNSVNEKTGETTLPNKEAVIQNFASFYVTGFPGDRCNSDPSTGNTEIVGHFIKYVAPSPTGTGSGACSENAFGNCIAILTK